ncbi:TonB-linked outer membrane protein, SusC/RagA family [Pricia antarctica]|uniref:TonB-linked outer membrane protein, SusC/RagA family n=1 Tax=Pricia antarctica TaxID=641691 RepID=A0A1G7IZS7_9FLAO|nr:TonB-dependent receptor [Pricia antarctica]SDF18128.1 TonB-linked outer membrane protein, SusC/RagA family [Pricia antarctica]
MEKNDEHVVLKKEHVKKLNFKMKFCLLTACFMLFQLSANSLMSQKKMEFEYDNVPLKRILNEITSQTGYRFFYNVKEIDDKQKISLNINGENVREVMNELAVKANFDFKINENQIVLTQGKTTSHKFQEREIEGTVTDEQGTPLPGANIIEKGTANGVTADFDGNFSISTDNENAILVVSYIGFATKEVAVEGKSEIQITLSEDSAKLDEVVVVGYGTVKRSDLTGATSSVSTKDIEDQPSGRVDEVLQGRSPGLAVQNSSASPNGNINIRIRGSNSVNGSNDPLVVVDGFVGGNLNTINPNDIADIQVLKDAASTAIYGSRGANGVVLVTTKTGRSDSKFIIGYDTFMSYQTIRKKIDLLNAVEYAETVNARRAALDVALPFTMEDIEGFGRNGGTDWQDEIFRPALQQSHQLSVSGGTEKSTLYLAGNYLNNEGIMKGSSYERFSFRANTQVQINDRLKVGVNLFLFRSEDNPNISGGSQDAAPTHAAQVYAPTLPVYNPDGSYSQPSGQYGPPQLRNPLALAVEPINDNIANNQTLNTSVDYKLSKNLSAKVIFGYRSIHNENSFYRNTKPEGGASQSRASITNSRFTVLQNTNQLNYNKTFSEVHSLDVTAVYEQQREDLNSSFTGAEGFASDAFTYNNLALGSFPQIPQSNRTRKDIQSFVGRINYGFKDRYLLTLTTRYDGASVFGRDNKWGLFPSAAFAWRLSNEAFMEQFSKINDFKIRASYGITGSQAVSPYSSLARFDSNQGYAIDGSTYSTGVGLGELGNPDLRWEKTDQLNIGLDLAMFKNRLQFTFDFYNKVTKDLLLQIPLPRTSGFGSLLRNIGEVQNRGFEINLGGDPITGNFSWNTNANFAVNENKVLALAGDNEVTLGSVGFPNFGNTVFLEVGQPIGLLRGYIQDGVWRTDEATEADTFGAFPGAPKYIDQNNDGQIDNDDIANMGTTLPKATYGWSNTFSYKNLSLNVLLQGSIGNKLYNLTRVRTERASSDSDATDSRILNRWTPENQNTDVPSFLGSNNYEQLQTSRWLEDASYLRFKNITLSYMFPQDLLKRLNINSARIFLSGINLITFTDYSGYDPEASTNVDAFGGIDNAPYPSQKAYSIGLNLSL